MDKQKLIEALKTEQLMLQKKGIDVTDHILTINFLETDKLSTNVMEEIEKYELLDASINDLETLYSDYVL